MAWKTPSGRTVSSVDAFSSVQGTTSASRIPERSPRRHPPPSSLLPALNRQASGLGSPSPWLAHRPPSSSTPTPPALSQSDPYDHDTFFRPSRISIPSLSPFFMGSHSWWRLKRVLSRPLPWISLLVVGCIIWWSSGATKELSSPEVQLKLRDLFPPEFTKDLQFLPASNHKIHYVGRWTTAPNRLRIDGAFPGVYFDVNVTNTSSLVLSLQNSRPNPSRPTRIDDTQLQDQAIHENGAQFPQYSFGVASKAAGSAPPISLLALVDQEEYVVLPNASSLVPIRMKDLDSRVSHLIRVIAPMTDDGGKGIVQMEGLWLDKGGALSAVEGSIAETRPEEEDELDPDGPEVGRSHRLGLGQLLHQYNRDQIHAPDAEETQDEQPDFRRRKKLIELVTDTAAHLTSVKSVTRNNGADGLLAGVMGWEYLLGEMFSVDHVCVGSEGMCLVHDCIGGTGEPSGMGDVFFRSGPAGSSHFAHPWPFQSYVPDVMIFNLGASDHYSFDHHIEEYNKTHTDLVRSFEDTYVSLVKAVRTLAYPSHPSILEAQRLGLDEHIDFDAPAAIPIFIMRPFNGELEHATQGAVNRLRSDGDKSVFWLDTTGWLENEDTETTQSDFFMDPDEPDAHPHLTERGNQKVAIYLHMHVCRFLAAEKDLCPFLPPEVYQGNVYDPGVATFDRYIENEKERQMREIFWGDNLRDL